MCSSLYSEVKCMRPWVAFLLDLVFVGWALPPIPILFLDLMLFFGSLEILLKYVLCFFSLSELLPPLPSVVRGLEGGCVCPFACWSFSLCSFYPAKFDSIFVWVWRPCLATEKAKTSITSWNLFYFLVILLCLDSLLKTTGETLSSVYLFPRNPIGDLSLSLSLSIKKCF